MSSGISTVWLFVHCSRTHWSFKKCWFLRRKEIWRTRSKTLGARTRAPPPKKKKEKKNWPTYDAESGNRTRATLV